MHITFYIDYCTVETTVPGTVDPRSVSSKSHLHLILQSTLIIFVCRLFYYLDSASRGICRRSFQRRDGLTTLSVVASFYNVMEPSCTCIAHAALLSWRRSRHSFRQPPLTLLITKENLLGAGSLSQTLESLSRFHLSTFFSATGSEAFCGSQSTTPLS
jgi:hypothetical protein